MRDGGTSRPGHCVANRFACPVKKNDPHDSQRRGTGGGPFLPRDAGHLDRPGHRGPGGAPMAGCQARMSGSTPQRRSPRRCPFVLDSSHGTRPASRVRPNGGSSHGRRSRLHNWRSCGGSQPASSQVGTAVRLRSMVRMGPLESRARAPTSRAYFMCRTALGHAPSGVRRAAATSAWPGCCSGQRCLTGVALVVSRSLPM